MPTYEYECRSCGHTFEISQSMRDSPLKICPECGQEIRRLINGGSGVIFKGAGFYSTDKQTAPAPLEPKPAKSDGTSAPVKEKTDAAHGKEEKKEKTSGGTTG